MLSSTYNPWRDVSVSHTTLTKQTKLWVHDKAMKLDNIKFVQDKMECAEEDRSDTDVHQVVKIV